MIHSDSRFPLLAVFLSATLLIAGCANGRAALPQASQAQQAVPRQEVGGAPKAVAAPVWKDVPVAPLEADAGRLIPLQGALNARSFAGLQGRHGLIPAGSFIRTADLSRLTPADRHLLAGQGVTLDVDLRTAEELADSPDVLADDARFGYVRISLLGEESIDIRKMPASLGELYEHALDANKAQFRQVFQTIAAQPDGTVLFHCTAGKDRTGMVSALLLSLAGVPEQDIVHNYAISAHYLKPMMESSQSGMSDKIKAHPNLAALMGTPPEAMEAFMAKLQDQYGGAEAYMRTIGLSDGEVQALLVRLGQAGR